MNMKKLYLIAVVAMAFAACSSPKKAGEEKTVAQQLEERLDSLRSKGYMAGHQDDPFYGIGWAY